MKIIETFAEKKAAVETTKAFITNEYKKCKEPVSNTYDLKHHIQYIFDVYYTQEQYEQILISLGFKVEQGAVNISADSCYNMFRKCHPDNEPQLELDNKLLSEKYNNMFYQLLHTYSGATPTDTTPTDTIPGSVKDFIRSNCKITKSISRVSPSIGEITRMLRKNVSTDLTDVQTYKILLDMGVKCANNRAAISIRDVERLTYNY